MSTNKYTLICMMGIDKKRQSLKPWLYQL